MGAAFGSTPPAGPRDRSARRSRDRPWPPRPNARLRGRVGVGCVSPRRHRRGNRSSPVAPLLPTTGWDWWQCAAGKPEARGFIDKARAEVIERGEGAGLEFMDWAEAVLYNGLGRYAEALAASRLVLERAELVPVNWAMPELVEAAVRTGARELAAETDRRLSDRSRASATDWALGIAARSHALVVEDGRADDLYAESIERLAAHASRGRPGPRAPALRRVASASVPSGGRS